MRDESVNGQRRVERERVAWSFERGELTVEQRHTRDAIGPLLQSRTQHVCPSIQEYDDHRRLRSHQHKGAASIGKGTNRITATPDDVMQRACHAARLSCSAP